jgi:hypothetical protein
MPTTYGILGQAAPAATTETDLYTVPALTSCVNSSYVVCNRGSTATTWRISASVGGAATSNKDYIDYDYQIPANESFKATTGITLGPGDVVRVYAGNANLSFSFFGGELT